MKLHFLQSNTFRNTLEVIGDNQTKIEIDFQLAGRHLVFSLKPGTDRYRHGTRKIHSGKSE